MSNELKEEMLLPTRDFLRQLIAEPVIKDKHLKDILRNRGVFFLSIEKEILGVNLIKTGLSPYEFEELKELVKTKEDTPKFKTRTIKWSSSENLIDCLPTNVDYRDIVDSKFGTVRVHTIDDFIAVNGDPNYCRCSFELVRENLIQNLGKNQTYHKGQVELTINPTTNMLGISLSHTSQETMRFAHQISTLVINSFKENHHIEKDAEVLVILFNDFDNPSRIHFFRELTKSPTTFLKFQDTIDIDLCPDRTQINLHPNISWMENRINSTKMKGKDLHSLFLLSDEEIFPYIQLYGLKCNYSIEYENITGSVSIDFEFVYPDISTHNSNELVLTIKTTDIDCGSSLLSRSELEKVIIASIETNKLKFYQKYAKK